MQWQWDPFLIAIAANIIWEASYMKNKAKILAAILAAASVSMSLAGCSGDDTTSSGAASTGSETSTESSAEESSAAASGETVNLSWIQIGPQPNDLQMVTDAMNEYSKEKINVTCDYTYLDWGIYSDRMKAMIQGGEYFDIMFLNGSTVYTQPAETGRLAALEDYLSEVPELEEFTPDSLWEGVTYKGHIYAVPTYKDSSCTNYWAWDKPTVDALGIPYEEIKTFADLDPWLYTVQDAINNGTADSAIGQYALYLTNTGLNGFAPVDTYDLNVDSIYLGANIEKADGQVVRILEQPDVMENLKLLHKWYNDGIINPDAPTATAAPTAKTVFFAQAYPGAEVGYALSAGRDVVMNVGEGPMYTTWTVQGSLNAISSSSEHIVESLKYLELCNLDPTMRNMLAYGVEGTHWTDNGDGTITRDEVKQSDYGPATYSQATFFTMSPITPNTADQWTQVQDWVEGSAESPYLGFMFDSAPVATELAACQALYAQYAPEIITGARDPETTVPEYYAAMDAAGLQTVQDEMQRQLDEFMASKGE